MVKTIFENTLGSSAASSTNENILETIKRIKKGFRSGIGSRSKILYTHPANRKDLCDLVKYTTEYQKDIFCPFPYRVITDFSLPKSIKHKTGRIIWNDTSFVNHSHGPAPGSNLSDEEYFDMCLYFGWAKEEVIEQMVWYEVDENTFNGFINALSTVSKVPSNREDEVKRNIKFLLEREQSFIPYERLITLRNFK